jgi:uncharacterized protein (DUF433 family)
VSIDLLSRPIYGFAEVDRLLALGPGTARRWIDGYRRSGVDYPPVVRPEPSGAEAVTWGEFIETRLLAGFRERGVSIPRLRPAVVRLREEFGPHPLARAHPLLDVSGRELVRRIETEAGSTSPESLTVVARNGQIEMSTVVESFTADIEYTRGPKAVAGALVPVRYGKVIRFDPLRQNGRPVVRSVPTDVIAEQFRAGAPTQVIAEDFDLDPASVEQALRFEFALSRTA